MKSTLIIGVLLLYSLLVFCLPGVARQVGTGSSLDNPTSSKSAGPPEIYLLNVNSQILSRFATTLVTSRLANRDEKPREAIFVVQLPDAAFISNFSMEIDGKVIVGEVKEKEKAKQEYEEAKSLGQSAGHVAQAPRKTNTFHISVNVAAMGKVGFNLTYQEILQRVHGVYKHIVNIQPGQVVNDLKVDIFITEAREITTIRVPEFGEKVGEKANQDLLKLVEAQDVTVKKAITPELSHVHVAYHPNVKKQKGTTKGNSKGLNGQLVVLYDVKRDKSGGDVQVVNGYFVHFFAPSDIPLSNKHAIFVLDTSGSMSGKKIAQTKDAMKVILEDLDENDLFNILEFDNDVRPWKAESVLANKDSIQNANGFVQELVASGGTNINAALQEGIKKLLNQPSSSNRNPVVIFLTDGQATTGITSNQAILNNAKETNNAGKVSIQSIGFGSGADFDLLKRLSLENHGLARKVYEDSDAALQLQGFYSEISSLLLSDVQVKYLNESVEPDSIVQHNTYNYYKGSEFMFVGKAKKKSTVFDAEVQGLSSGGLQKFKTSSRIFCPRPVQSAINEKGFVGCIRPYPPHKPQTVDYEPLAPETIGGFIERMWAYLSIKKLLEKSKYDSKADATALKKKALDLSLKYHFVTELTSMVVIQPGKNKTKPLAEGDLRRDRDNRKFSSRSFSGRASASAAKGGRRRKLAGKPSYGASGPTTGGLFSQGIAAGPAPAQFAPPPPQAPLPPPKPASTAPQKTQQTNEKLDSADDEVAVPILQAKREKAKTATTSCSFNQTLNANNCEYTCEQTYTIGLNCPNNGACKCKARYLRTSTGNCVLPLDCPAVPKSCFDSNAKVSACGKACRKTCATLKTASTSPCVLCGPPACVCKAGYVLSEAGRNGSCVLQSDCP